MRVDNAVAVAAVLDLVVFRQRKKSIGLLAIWLRRKVPEKLLAVIDRTVTVSSSAKKALRTPGAVHAHLNLLPGSRDIE